MAENNTIETDYIIDDSDKDLFLMMKSIVDTDFSTESMWAELYKQCWNKKRRISVEEISDNRVYIHFPKINPLVRLLGTILMPFTSKDDQEEEEEE